MLSEPNLRWKSTGSCDAGEGPDALVLRQKSYAGQDNIPQPPLFKGGIEGGLQNLSGNVMAFA